MKIEFDASVRAHVLKGKLIKPRQKQLNIREERFQATRVVVTQGRVYSRIETRLLKLCNFKTRVKQLDADASTGTTPSTHLSV